MKVLVIGWELPPFHSGGLGVACYHLSRELSRKGVDVTFVLPEKKDFSIKDFRLLFANISSGGFSFPAYASCLAKKNAANGQGFDFLSRVPAYAQKIVEIAKKEKFDLIHAHDWLCFPAGIAAAKASGKPLIAHVHITEFDKTGGKSADQRIYKIEREGMEKADRVVTVSESMKKKITNHYQIKPEKITVVHNGVEMQDWQGHFSPPLFKTKNKKLVLFLGRLTLQKGADWLLKAAKKAIEVDPDVLFAFTGSGEMMPQLIRQAIGMGINQNVFFTGWLKDKERIRIYKAADLYVMPSISDPFGITALEAMASGTPTLVSRQVGAGEALKHVLKVDFWDTDQMAAKILAALRYKPLASTLKENGFKEAQHFSWQNAADKCIGVYNQLVL